MSIHLSRRETDVAVSPDGLSESGLLILADGALVAVISRLERSGPEEMRGRWYLEAGFGPCAVAASDTVLFGSPEEAEHWAHERIARKAATSG